MEQKQAVVFELDNCMYGIDIMKVDEIIRMVNITPVPETDYFVEGIINLRGQVIPVINLCRKLGLNAREYSNDNRIIVTQSGDRKFGMIVDRVQEVGAYDDTELSSVDDVGIDDSVVHEIVKKEDCLWIILDTESLR